MKLVCAGCGDSKKIYWPTVADLCGECFFKRRKGWHVSAKELKARRLASNGITRTRS